MTEIGQLTYSKLACGEYAGGSFLVRKSKGLHSPQIQAFIQSFVTANVLPWSWAARGERKPASLPAEVLRAGCCAVSREAPSHKHGPEALHQGPVENSKLEGCGLPRRMRNALQTTNETNEMHEEPPRFTQSPSGRGASPHSPL